MAPSILPSIILVSFLSIVCALIRSPHTPTTLPSSRSSSSSLKPFSSSLSTSHHSTSHLSERDTAIYSTPLGTSVQPVTGLEAALKALETKSDCVRIFHPAFPHKLTTPIKADEIRNIYRLKELMGDTVPPRSYEGLPWKPLPFLKITTEEKDTWNSVEIEEGYEKFKHCGHVVWAHKIKRPERGCMLLNHWQQRVIYLTDYDVTKGAKGYELSSNGPGKFINWPPLVLESELVANRWQPMRVSENLFSGEVFSSMPPQMTRAQWELIFLLSLSPTKDAEAYQALFDTGLSPRQGLIAYIRLIEKVIARAETFDGVPNYRKIAETELKA